MVQERRKAPRNRVLQGASVIFNGRQSVMDCRIRNRSDAGMMLRMTDWITLPDMFDVDLPAHGESFRVRQCWRRGDDIGVAFLTEKEISPQSPIRLDIARSRRAACINL